MSDKEEGWVSGVPYTITDRMGVEHKLFKFPGLKDSGDLILKHYTSDEFGVEIMIHEITQEGLKEGYPRYAAHIHLTDKNVLEETDDPNLASQTIGESTEGTVTHPFRADSIEEVFMKTQIELTNRGFEFGDS